MDHYKLISLAFSLLLTNVVSAKSRFESLSVDISDVLQHGCRPVEARKEGTCCVPIPAHLDCTEAGLEQKYACSPVYEVPSYLGGLNPKVPIVECVIYIDPNVPDKNAIRYLGTGFNPIYNKFIVFTAGQFRVLNNPSEFREFYSPIDTPEEALSYAAALTGSYPLYRIEIPKGYKRESKTITSTFVREIQDGFQVHLFDYKEGGCGPHYYYSIDYEVTKDGDVKEISRQNVWRNPKQDRICVD